MSQLSERLIIPLYLFNDTLVENVTIGINYSQKEIDEILERVQLRDLASAYMDALGDGGIAVFGGEKQRIALARALIRHPRILICNGNIEHMKGQGTVLY